MTASFRRSSLLLALLAGSLQAAPAETPHQAECAVWQRELSFARSVADHDAAAFAEHLHPQAVDAPGNERNHETLGSPLKPADSNPVYSR